MDVLYDHRVNLIISAACPAEALYTEGPQTSEFVRTVSRLVEMRTHEYLATAHRLQVADGTDQDMSQAQGVADNAVAAPLLANAG